VLTRLKKADLGGKTLSGSPGHMRKNAYYRNLKWRFEDWSPCYWYAIKTESTTIGWQVSQPASVGKGSNMSELRSCAEHFGGLAVTTLPRWASRSSIGPCLHD